MHWKKLNQLYNKLKTLSIKAFTVYKRHVRRKVFPSLVKADISLLKNLLKAIKNVL